MKTRRCRVTLCDLRTQQWPGALIRGSLDKMSRSIVFNLFIFCCQVMYLYFHKTDVLLWLSECSGMGPLLRGHHQGRVYSRRGTTAHTVLPLKVNIGKSTLHRAIDPTISWNMYALNVQPDPASSQPSA